MASRVVFRRGTPRLAGEDDRPHGPPTSGSLTASTGRCSCPPRICSTICPRPPGCRGDQLREMGITADSEQRPVPRAAHRPSRTVPPIKGSEVIVPVLERLHERGVIDYISDRERSPPPICPTSLRNATSWSIRSGPVPMESRRQKAWQPACGGRQYSPQVREFVGDEIPIVDGAPEDFEAAIIALARTRTASSVGKSSVAAMPRSGTPALQRPRR